MDLKELPKEIEDLILDYKSQLDHMEKMKPILKEIEEMNYRYDEVLGTSSFVVGGNKVWRSYRLYLCNRCGKYVNSTRIDYDFTTPFHIFRYNYYNNRNRGIQENYTLEYTNSNHNWVRQYQYHPTNKYVNCNCEFNIFLHD